MSVAALHLVGVGDAVWDIEVVNGRQPAGDVVWQRRLSSSGYGDGSGSASYVGPCDADPSVRENTVKVWLVGVYSAPAGTLGSFASGGLGGASTPDLAFQSPTTEGPLTRKILCNENGDVAAQFDIALMRPAEQGFFDVAVNFNDIFCAAKLDCCNDTNDDGTCDADIALLHDAAGNRARTMVLGFACTAGPDTDVETALYMSALTLDCTNPSDAGAFNPPDIAISPAGAAGNQCTPAATGMSTCPAITLGQAVADTYLFQVGLYHGEEQLRSNGGDAHSVYWNVALGVKAPISGCHLRLRATADDAGVAGVLDAGEVALGSVYPYVLWDADLGTCVEEELTFGSTAAPVRTDYTRTDDTTATSFAYGYDHDFGPAALAPCSPNPCLNGGLCEPGSGSFTCTCVGGYTGALCSDAPGACGLLGVACPAGFSCNAALAEGSDYDAFCVSDGTDAGFPANAMVYVPAGTFWMGCNSTAQGGTDADCEDHEYPQHEVTLSAYTLDRTEVTAQAYHAWCGDDGFDVTVDGWTGTCLPGGREGNSPYGTYKPESGSWTKASHPVTYLSHHQAAAYCTAQGKRLCTEAEWERAARGGCETVTGTCRTSMRKYPWEGTPVPTCTLANYDNGAYCYAATYTLPADALVAGTSPYGAMNMAGNVWEWSADWYLAYPGAPTAFDYTGTYRTFRGGSFAHGVARARASQRYYNPPQTVYGDFGVRCCQSYP